MESIGYTHSSPRSQASTHAVYNAHKQDLRVALDDFEGMFTTTKTTTTTNIQQLQQNMTTTKIQQIKTLQHLCSYIYIYNNYKNTTNKIQTTLQHIQKSQTIRTNGSNIIKQINNLVKQHNKQSLNTYKIVKQVVTRVKHIPDLANSIEHENNMNYEISAYVNRKLV
jgi:hypothetical protein